MGLGDFALSDERKKISKKKDETKKEKIKERKKVKEANERGKRDEVSFLERHTLL